MRTLLIVDNNKFERASLSLWFEDENFQVLLAANVPEALKLTKENLPDLILSDINMPNLNGFDFYEMLSGDEKLKNIPFIFLSGSSLPEDIEKTIKLNILLVAKPCNLDHLTEIIKQKLNMS